MPRVNIYIKDDKEFAKLRTEVRYLWYKKFGESLTNSKVLVKALLYLRDSLAEKADTETEKSFPFGWIRK